MFPQVVGPVNPVGPLPIFHRSTDEDPGLFQWVAPAVGWEDFWVTDTVVRCRHCWWWVSAVSAHWCWELWRITGPLQLCQKQHGNVVLLVVVVVVVVDILTGFNHETLGFNGIFMGIQWDIEPTISNLGMSERLWETNTKTDSWILGARIHFWEECLQLLLA